MTRSHPLFTSCGRSPWEVDKATTQARLLSGRYRLEAVSGHWTPWNREGLCVLPDCWATDHSHKGTVENFLLSCPSLSPTRQYLENYRQYFFQAKPHLFQLVQECLDTDPVQFWLDASTMAPVISATQSEGDVILEDIFRLTRTYCQRLHKTRCEMLEDMWD